MPCPTSTAFWSDVTVFWLKTVGLLSERDTFMSDNGPSDLVICPMSEAKRHRCLIKALERFFWSPTNLWKAVNVYPKSLGLKWTHNAFRPSLAFKKQVVGWIARRQVVYFRQRIGFLDGLLASNPVVLANIISFCEQQVCQNKATYFRLRTHLFLRVISSRRFTKLTVCFCRKFAWVVPLPIS